ncbi:MAG: UPF0149 family protein [Methylococcales bacterium]|nr:UPF0149 family protein [Methylococcales bacterium]
MNVSHTAQATDLPGSDLERSTWQGQVAALSCLGLCPGHYWSQLNPEQPYDDQLKAWAEHTDEQIRSDDAEFALLLPDDDMHLALRIGCLRAFCQAFVDTMAHIASLDPPRAEAFARHTPGEILYDMIEISKISPHTEQTDADERDFMELTEYLRVAVRVFALNYPSISS